MTTARAVGRGRSSSRERPEGLAPSFRGVLAPDGTLLGPEPAFEDAELVRLFRAMVRARAADERAQRLSEQGRIGPHVSCRGQEAALVGAGYALEPGDAVFASYRGAAGIALTRGLPLERYLDNLFGNARDIAKGRQMPDHLSGRAWGLASAGSLVGNQITHAVGYAWAAKLKRDPKVVLVGFHGSAAATGELHNGLNFAGVFGVPLVLLGITSSPEARLADRGIAYGVEAVRCDGSDVLAVVATVREAAARARGGQGPTLIEARIASVGDESWPERDPHLRMRRLLARRVGWDDEQQTELELSIAEELDEALAAAEGAEPPPLGSMFDDAFAELPRHLAEQQSELLAGPRPT